MHVISASEWAALQLDRATEHVHHLLSKVLIPPVSVEYARPTPTLTSDVVSYSAGISACEKGKHWQGAICLLQEMLHKGSRMSNVVRHSMHCVVQAADLLQEATVWHELMDLHLAKIVYGMVLKGLSAAHAVSACEKSGNAV